MEEGGNDSLFHRDFAGIAGAGEDIAVGVNPAYSYTNSDIGVREVICKQGNLLFHPFYARDVFSLRWHPI